LGCAVDFGGVWIMDFFFGFFDLIVSLVRFDEFMGVLFKVLAFF